MFSATGSIADSWSKRASSKLTAPLETARYDVTLTHLLVLWLRGGEELGEGAGETSRRVEQPVAVVLLVQRRQQPRVLGELRQVRRAVNQKYNNNNDVMCQQFNE